MLGRAASAAGAFALSAALALTMTPAAAFVGAGGSGEAHAATTSALEGSAATAAANRVSQDMALESAAAPAGQPAPARTDGNGNPVQIKSATLSVGSDEFAESDYRFRTLGSTGEAALIGVVAGFDTATQPIEVPGTASAPIGDTYNVTSIALDGLGDLSNVAVLNVPATVNKIEKGALANLPSLKTVVVNGVAAVEDGAFADGQAEGVAVAVAAGNDVEACAAPWRAAGVANVVDVAAEAGKTAFVPAADVEGDASADAATVDLSDGDDAVKPAPSESSPAEQPGFLYTLREDGMLDVEWQGDANEPEDANISAYAEIDDVSYQALASMFPCDYSISTFALSDPTGKKFIDFTDMPTAPNLDQNKEVGRANSDYPRVYIEDDLAWHVTFMGNRSDKEFIAPTAENVNASWSPGTAQISSAKTVTWGSKDGYQYFVNKGVLYLACLEYNAPLRYFGMQAIYVLDDKGNIDTGVEWHMGSASASKIPESTSWNGTWITLNNSSSSLHATNCKRPAKRTVYTVSNSDALNYNGNWTPVEGSANTTGYAFAKKREGIDDGTAAKDITVPPLAPNFVSDKNGESPLYVRTDASSTINNDTGIYHDRVMLTPSNLAVTSINADFDLEVAKINGSGGTLYGDTDIADPTAGGFTYRFDGKGNTDEESAVSWTLPGVKASRAGYTFQGWHAKFESDTGSGMPPAEADFDVPQTGYTQGDTFTAGSDMRDFFRAIAKAGSSKGAGVSVKFTARWKASAPTYRVYLCDYPDGFGKDDDDAERGPYDKIPVDGHDGSLTIGNYSDSVESRYKKITPEQRAAWNAPAEAVWYTEYAFSEDAGSRVNLPEAAPSATFQDGGYAYKPGYVFDGWVVRGDATNWNTWNKTANNSTATQSLGPQKVSEGATESFTNTGTGSQTIGRGAWGDLALWPVLTEKTYKVSYTLQFENTDLVDHPGERTDTFSASEVFLGDGAALPTANAKDPVYGFAFKGWSATNPARGQGYPPNDGKKWTVNSPESHIWDTLGLGAWKDTYHAKPKENAEGSSTGVKDSIDDNSYESTIALYSVWSSAGTTQVTLGGEEPVSIRKMTGSSYDVVNGKYVGLDSKAVDAASATGALYMWRGRGITYRASDMDDPLTKDDTYYTGQVELDFSMHYVDNQESKGAFAMGAPKRDGYTFMGWGVTEVDKGDAVDKDGDPNSIKYYMNQAIADGDETQSQYVREHPERDIYSTLYIRYAPGEGEDGVNGGDSYKLTKAGSDLVSEWAKNGNNSDTTWVAVWKVDEYQLSQRVAKSAVQATGLSDKWNTAADASAGWFYYTNTYPYWHTVDVPKYEEITSTFTYEGWYKSQVGVERLASGSGDANNAGKKFDGQPNKYVDYAKFMTAASDAGMTGATATDLAYDRAKYLGEGLLLNETGTAPFRVTGDLGGTAEKAVDIWMRHRAVQIGLDAPVSTTFFDLCAAEGDAAYEVGTDGRELLEAPIQITTTSNTSHEMYVSNVEFTTDEYERDGSGNVVTDAGGKPVPAFSEADKEKQVYLAHKLLKNNGDYVMGKDEGGKDIPNDQLYFWLAADKTVDYGKTEEGSTANWNYSIDKTKEAGGKDLKRVYFGIREASEKSGGVTIAANNALNASNVADLKTLVLGMPNGDGTDEQTDSGHGKYNYTYEGTKTVTETVTDPDANKETTVEKEVGTGTYYRVNTFWYGLDLRKCSIDPKAVMTYAGYANKGAGDEWTPRLGKLKFTFEALAHDREKSALSALSGSN